MTTPPTPPRARRLGVLGVAVYTLLSPSGKIISVAAAAILLAGGLLTQLRPPSPPAAQAPAPTPVAPTRLAHSASSAPVFTYIEVDGQMLPVVVTENPTSNRSVGRGPGAATPSLGLSGGGGRGPGSASPSIYPSSGSGRGPGAGSPHIGSRPDSPSPGSGGLPPEASQPDGTPMPPPTAGHTPPTHLAGSGDPADNESNDAGLPPPQGEPGSESRELPDSVPGVLSEAPESRFTPGNDAGAPMSPLQDEPRYELLEPPFFGSVPSPFDAPESQRPTGMDDPLNPPSPLIAFSEQPEPLLRTSPYDSQSLPQIAAAVPEPSVIGLMLLGLAALGWAGRRRQTATRRA
jgi:hypothetical protein